VGPPKNGDNVNERNNRWALYSALARGIDKVRLIAVWDGKGETPKDLDARLVKHMVDLMRDTGGIVEQINPVKLSSPAPTPVPAVAENNAHVSMAVNGKSSAQAVPTKPAPRKKKKQSKTNT
jgi:hypothetical protein